MTMSASEFYEAGMALPPAVRKGVALRLLDSLEVADQDSVDQAWTQEISARVDELLAGKAKAASGKQVFAELDARWAARRDDLR